MDGTTTQRHARTLVDLLATQNRAALARVLHRPRTVVHRWATGEAVPGVADLPALSQALHIDLAELTLIVSADAIRIAEQKKAVA